MTKNVTLNDGSSLEVGLTGNSGGKVIMLPIAKKSVFGQEAENLKLWGVDPELGKHFVEGLSSTFQVLFFDYEGYLFEHPKPDQLTAGNVASDFLHIADAMNVNTFSYYGYSWLALAGLQLAIRTNRLDSLIMGGFPPYRGPYQEMLTVTTKSHKQALSQIYNGSQPEVTGINTEEVDWNNVQVQMDPNQTKQFLTLYQSLMDFDDTLVQDKLVFPKLAFAGEKDTIVYGENFGKVTVDIAGLLNKHKEALKHFGWDIRILKGEMDHTKAMQPEAVLPLIKPWLVGKLLG
ncbi:alpha/beta fold hydrolase [Paenibacillus sp. J22TS3]|uniref:alpha/beta fold hydrolase n=1 Tax=Paenibacillus sp. J22TS3 TaxID=2807192 RepID=UPI001BCC5A91|nr:alpha/beta hydrolase [Paenibacillus sp. J22TS3]